MMCCCFDSCCLCCVADPGRDKLGYRECVTAVLEADGTEVDEDDYFRFLEDHTTFILLRETDQWTSSQHAVSESSSGEDSDVVDASTAYRPTVERLQLTGAAPATRDRSLAQLSRTLRKDFTQIVTFSRNELQVRLTFVTTSWFKYNFNT